VSEDAGGRSRGGGRKMERVVKETDKTNVVCMNSPDSEG